jgi:nucleoside-diphosphate-sugar epimerase
MKPTVIVFGGTGYVGTSISGLLTERGMHVIRAGRHTPQDAYHLQVDITNHNALEDALAIYSREGRVVALVHSASPRVERVRASLASEASRNEHMRVAVTATESLFSLAQKYRIPHVILITSAAAFLAPESHLLGAYPEAKRAQEELAAHTAHTEHDMRIHTIAPGFLSGGLNDDLPRVFREHAAKASGGTAHDVAQTIGEILSPNTRFLESGRINPHTGVMTPF